MSKTHEEYMEEYLRLDKHQRIPFRLILHFLFCSKCRNEVKALTKAEKLSAEPLNVPVPLKDDTIQKVLAKVNSNLAPQKKRNLIPRWVSSGIILILTMLSLGYITRSFDNEYYTFWAFMLFTIAFIVYILVFFASNMELFIKRINTKTHKGSGSPA